MRDAGPDTLPSIVKHNGCCCWMVFKFTLDDDA